MRGGTQKESKRVWYPLRYTAQGNVAATSDLGQRSRLGVGDLSQVRSSHSTRLEVTQVDRVGSQVGCVVRPENAIESMIKICDMGVTITCA
jgi:hypothetical protein